MYLDLGTLFLPIIREVMIWVIGREPNQGVTIHAVHFRRLEK